MSPLEDLRASIHLFYQTRLMLDKLSYQALYHISVTRIKLQQYTPVDFRVLITDILNYRNQYLNQNVDNSIIYQHKSCKELQLILYEFF